MHSHNPADIPLQDYFSHIGLNKEFKTEPTLETLATLIQRHIATFIYRNTHLYKAGQRSIDNRKIPSLEPHSIFARMQKKRGGYCFQHLELFYAALKEIGFIVDRHLAKIILKNCADYQIDAPLTSLKTHELLVVHLNDKRYLIDIGMGYENIRLPLELKEGKQTLAGDHYRLTKIDNYWVFDRFVPQKSQWFCLYHFFDAGAQLVDINNAHTNLYQTSEKIPIRDDKIFIAQTTATKRKQLFWDIHKQSGIFISVTTHTGKEKKQIFSSREELEKFSRRKFKTF